LRLIPRPADDAEFLHGLPKSLARIEAKAAAPRTRTCIRQRLLCMPVASPRVPKPLTYRLYWRAKGRSFASVGRQQE
jgi:hypothetical protein